MKRRNFSAKCKTKVVLEALSNRYTVQELARKYDLHANQISKWKSHFVENADTLFEKEPLKKGEDSEAEKAKLYKIIGEQKVQLDFLRKASSDLGL